LPSSSEISRSATASTLFPYTPLFRSGAARPPHHAPALMVLRRRRVGAARRNRSAMALLVQKLSGTPPRDSVVSGNTDTSTGVTADRKSTRLNSSHLGISYAVFCLKKK